MCYKKKFGSRKEAKEAAKFVTRKYGSVKAAYYCRECSVYHIGGSTMLATWLILRTKEGQN